MSSFVEEALRVNQRFLTEVVEAFGFCPWAAGARTSGALHRAVLLDEDAELAVEQVLKLDERVLVAILIFPRFTGPPERFEELLLRVRTAEEARRGGRSPFVTALFHPALRWSFDSPQQLVPFFRRSPDPAIQFVRFSSLESVRSGSPSGKFLFEASAAGWAELARRLQTVPVSDRIAQSNFDVVLRAGLARIEAIYADIAADRAKSYRRFGES